MPMPLPMPWTCTRCLRRLGLSLARCPPRRLASTTTTTTTTTTTPSLSPALLARARASATEHASLSHRLSAAFDAPSAKRAGELAPIAAALAQYDSATSQLAELRALLHDPAADQELRALAADDIDHTHSLVTTASRDLQSSLIPQHPFAHLPCLLEIRPGAGGSEAALFAGDLLKMYTSFCARRGLRASLLKYEDAAGGTDADAPLQEAILQVGTEGAYAILRTEAGVHRVQRVPATEAKGRTHTSAASVLVLPDLPEHADGMDKMDDPESDYYVSSADVRTDVMRARGAGGQHVNTTDSAVRLTHAPSGIVVQCQDQRSQLKNRAKAWQILRARLAQSRREAREEQMLQMRRSTAGHGKTGRGDKVRTYNWGQQRVTDHRSGLTLNQLDSVMDGGEALDEVMESVRAWYEDREIEALADEVLDHKQ